VITVAAVDLGAASGRVMRVRVGPDRLDLEEVHRFPNEPVRVRGTLYWDVLSLYRETLTGLAKAGPVDGIGIDSWAVDHGLLDGTGSLIGNPVHYRDERTSGVMERVLGTVSPEELYAVTGLQQLPFNTIYQLVSTPSLDTAETMLLIPDLFAYWLTGSIGAEATNASTTQLYDVNRKTWAVELAEKVGIPSRLLPPIRQPGTVIGTMLDTTTPVIAVGSHDTASAVVAVPASDDENVAYISSGTWSLVGVELDRPVLTEEARLANFTNEGGVDGRIRFLRNVMGLWLLQESMRTWGTTDLDGLLREAAAAEPARAVIDPDHPSFLAPGNIPERIAEYCRSTGQPVVTDRVETVRCILESLALAYGRTVRTARELSGKQVDAVHVIGGGAHNALLCQLTADACGVPVLAGPAEATAIGNALVQARALGARLPDLTTMRALVRATHPPRRYAPRVAARRT
jgi:rhamnulokinase